MPGIYYGGGHDGTGYPHGNQQGRAFVFPTFSGCSRRKIVCPSRLCWKAVWLMWRKMSCLHIRLRAGCFRKNVPVAPQKQSCFVCSEVNRVMDRMLQTLIHTWEKDESFRSLYDQQPVICLEHCRQLTALAPNVIGKRAAPFIAQTQRITRAYLEALGKDVTHFCRMYDYRNKGQDWGNSRDSIERAIWFLTTRKPEEEK